MQTTTSISVRACRHTATDHNAGSARPPEEPRERDPRNARLSPTGGFFLRSMKCGRPPLDVSEQVLSSAPHRQQLPSNSPWLQPPPPAQPTAGLSLLPVPFACSGSNKTSSTNSSSDATTEHAPVIPPQNTRLDQKGNSRGTSDAPFAPAVRFCVHKHG